jgi:hypothetical protein
VGKVAEASVARLVAERDETLRALLGLRDEDCRKKLEFYGREQSVNRVLRSFTAHAHDHFQHLLRLLQARGRPLSEAELLLMKAHAAQAELEALLLSLSDEEFTQGGPNPEDWSAQQIVDHLAEIERNYREAIRQAV